MGAALVMMTSAVAAQEKPNFSGKWALDAEKTAAANPTPQGGGGGGGGGRPGGMGSGPLTLTVDAATLTSEREGPNGVVKLVYKLDGTEQTITMGQGEAKAKAKWEGNTLVVETTREGQNGVMTTKAIYTIEGDYLVINNETLRGSRKMFYRKAS